MHPQQTAIQKTLDALRNAHDVASKELSDPAIDNIRTRIAKGLEGNISFLAQLINASGSTAVAGLQNSHQAPVRSIMGKPVAPIATKTADTIGKESNKDIANNQAISELQESANKLYPEFNGLENTAILDSYSDLEIRAVAIKAGLPFTETSPKKVTAKTIDQIKAAITKKAEMDAIGKEKVDE